MGETIHRLDYERRAKEWLKRRSKINTQPRECRENIRASQKREEKILVQKLARVDLAIRLLSLDFKRDVQAVEALHKTILTRSVKFDDKMFKNDTSNCLPNSSGSLKRISHLRGRRFRQKITTEDECAEDLLDNPKVIKQKKRMDSTQREPLVPGTTELSNCPCPSSNRGPSKLLFVISESNDIENQQDGETVSPAIEEDIMRPSSCQSQLEALPSKTPIIGLGLLRSASICIEDTNLRLGSAHYQRRSSTPLQRSSEKFPTRPASSRRGSTLTRPESASSNLISTDIGRPSSAILSSSSKSQPIRTFGNPGKSDFGFQKEADDQQTAARFHSFRSMSCDIAPVGEDLDFDQHRPQTADAINKPLNSLYFGSDSRSFKSLRDRYKGVYQEDLDPAIKRVISLRLQETQNVQRLRMRVQHLCEKWTCLGPEGVT